MLESASSFQTTLFSPVLNLEKGWRGSDVLFHTWCNLRSSDITFFSCSECTAFNSRPVQLVSNRGEMKNCANLLLEAES